MSHAEISAAFHDASQESQTIFRAVMQAMAQPGRAGSLDVGFRTPAPLGPTAGAILLCLADFETPIWLDEALSTQERVIDFLRFHTGARLTNDPQMATLAVIADAERAPQLSAFAQGTPDYPDRSTTVIFQVETLDGQDFRLAGPGIDGETSFGASPLPEDFAQQLASNNARFPLGVDVILAGQNQIAALPRSTRIVEVR